jgi:hypothetical protein
VAYVKVGHHVKKIVEDIMNKLFNFITGLMIVFVYVAISAVITGTLVFWLWPVAIPAIFPTLVASGALAMKITWWQSVCVSWIFALLLKGSSSSSSKN